MFFGPGFIERFFHVLNSLVKTELLFLLIPVENALSFSRCDRSERLGTRPLNASAHCVKKHTATVDNVSAAPSILPEASTGFPVPYLGMYFDVDQLQVPSDSLLSHPSDFMQPFRFKNVFKLYDVCVFIISSSLHLPLGMN
jgi:hypothetical protein